MHSGLVKYINISAKTLSLPAVLLAIFILSSCKDDAVANSIGFSLPEQGQLVSVGDDVKVKLDVPPGESVTSVLYLVDGKYVASKENGEVIDIRTGGMSVGYKLITAIVSHGRESDRLTINIVLKAKSKPELFGYKVVNSFPHDTSSYTQGFEFHEGRFLESTGLEGSSTLRWVDVRTGRAVHMINVDKKYSGEGSTMVDDKIIMLTWKGNEGLVFDANSLEQLGAFQYQNSREGWGLCYDGKQLIKSDGTNRLYFLNKDTYKEEKAIDVYDDEGTVESINELEYIDGKVFANIYTKDYLVVINPVTGIVERKIDLSELLEKGYRKSEKDTWIDVLNGIAWDSNRKRLFVTGKKWPRLFEITLVRR